MNARIRIALLVVVGLVLLWLAWTGVTQGVNQMGQSRTPGQVIQTVTQFAFGLFAALSLVTTFWWRRWNRRMLGALIVSLTLAGGLASIIWGGTSILMGCAAGAATLLISLGLAWVLRFAARGLRPGGNGSP